VKTLGIIGGTGPESTVEYYQRLIAGYRARSPDGGAPAMVINSIDNRKMIDWFTATDLPPIVDFLAAEVERLARAGVDFALIAANTPHLVFDELQKRSRLPLLSIVEATADAAAGAGLRRLALFGTRFTMQSSAMFPAAFARRGMAIVVPNESEQIFIHEKYMGELFFGKILDETRAALLEIVEAMKRRDGIDAVILGGTELSLILREPTAAGLPVLDTTQIHVDAAIAWLLRP
jgi:aspartate racemase